MRKQVNILIIKLLFFLVPLFIVGYCSYPYLIPHFVSIEQANKSNIKKFEHNRIFFQDVINVCIKKYKDNYSKQSKAYLRIEDIPIEMQKGLINKGINSFEAILDNNDGELTVRAYLYTERFWYNTRLNNVIIKYSSYYRNDTCNENDLNTYMGIICLGGGWFFEIDTDWK